MNSLINVEAASVMWETYVEWHVDLELPRPPNAIAIIRRNVPRGTFAQILKVFHVEHSKAFQN